MSTGNFQSHQATDCSSEVLRLATETIPLDSVQVTPGGGSEPGDTGDTSNVLLPVVTGAEAGAGEAVAAWESPAVVPEVGPGWVWD
jgi:hypothetical protein